MTIYNVKDLLNSDLLHEVSKNILNETSRNTVYNLLISIKQYHSNIIDVRCEFDTGSLMVGCVFPKNQHWIMNPTVVIEFNFKNGIIQFDSSFFYNGVEIYETSGTHSIQKYNKNVYRPPLLKILEETTLSSMQSFIMSYKDCAILSSALLSYYKEQLDIEGKLLLQSEEGEN